MHQNTSSRGEAILDELVTCRKVLEQILVVDVVDFDDFVLKAFEECLVEGQAEDG